MFLSPASILLFHPHGIQWLCCPYSNRLAVQVLRVPHVLLTESCRAISLLDTVWLLTSWQCRHVHLHRGSIPSSLRCFTTVTAGNSTVPHGPYAGGVTLRRYMVASSVGSYSVWVVRFCAQVSLQVILSAGGVGILDPQWLSFCYALRCLFCVTCAPERRAVHLMAGVSSFGHLFCQPCHR